MFPLLLSAALAQPADPADTDSRVLAKGDGYVVHAVRVGAKTPGAPTANPPGRHGVPGFGPRYSVLHVETKTGRLKKLVEGGGWSVPLQPMAVDRTYEHTASIAAVATGPDRLYVLVVRSSVLIEFIGAARRREPTVRHVLFVFRLADGTTVQELALPEPAERLGGFDHDTLDADLIRVAPTTVTVGAAVYRVGERLEPVGPKP